jgi:OPA family glycerol-3-phosphate transporter-like MFS transporter
MSNAKYLIALIASVLTGNAIAGAVMSTLLPYEQLPAAVTMLNLVLIPACFWVIGMLPGNRASPPSRLSAAIPAHDVSLEKELSLWEILWNNVLTNKIIWLFAIANLFVYVVRYSLIDWGPTYLKQAKGASMQTGGFSTLAFEASAIVSTLLIGWISDKSGGRRGMVSLICMIPVFLAFLGMIVMPPGFLWAHIVLFGVVGFFIYPPVMLLGVAGLDFTSKKAVGAAAGFIGLLGYTGKFVEGIALGVLSKELGWPGALSFIAASCIVAILMLAFTWKLKPAE